MQLVDSSLGATKASVDACTQAVSRLRLHAQANLEKRRACEEWKAKRAPLLEALEEKVSRLETIGGVNLERVVLEIERKKEMCQQLQGTEAALELSARAIEARQRRGLEQIQDAMVRDKRIIDRAENKLLLFRSAFEAGDWDDPDSDVTYWRDQYASPRTRWPWLGRTRTRRSWASPSRRRSGRTPRGRVCRWPTTTSSSPSPARSRPRRTWILPSHLQLPSRGRSPSLPALRCNAARCNAARCSRSSPARGSRPRAARCHTARACWALARRVWSARRRRS